MINIYLVYKITDILQKLFSFRTDHYTTCLLYTSTTIIFNGKNIPFGTRYIFASSTNPEFKFGIEICEDLWLPDSPSIKLALNGANLILNPSASNEITTKKDYRRLLINSQSARLVCGYIYSLSLIHIYSKYDCCR